MKKNQIMRFFKKGGYASSEGMPFGVLLSQDPFNGEETIDAVKELENEGLLESKGSETFWVLTKKGYLYAKTL